MTHPRHECVWTKTNQMGDLSVQKPFDSECRKCRRLVEFLSEVKSKNPDYHARPVPAFGDTDSRLLIVGLAPGMHGANASGRPFTGDYAGILLYKTLYDFGFSNFPESRSRDDGLKLHKCRITNAVKCLPPDNKPVAEEINHCNNYLHAELQQVAQNAVLLALGTIAHRAIIRARGLRSKDYPFGHGVVHPLADGCRIVDSYHCSRYNIQTRRLTPEMFTAVFITIKRLLEP